MYLWEEDENVNQNLGSQELGSENWKRVDLGSTFYHSCQINYNYSPIVERLFHFLTELWLRYVFFFSK